MRKQGYLAILVIGLALGFGLATVTPALATPTVASVTETAFGTDITDHHVGMPATIDAGDLLIVSFTNDGGATVTTPAGWSSLASNANGNQVRMSVYGKIAAGTEGGTTVNLVTSAAEQAAAQVYRITDWHGTTPPAISTAVIGTDMSPDPASFDPVGWDVADTLWIAVAGQDRGNQAGTTAYPDNYTSGTSTLSSNTNQGCRILSARRLLTAAGEDPGAFTLPVSEQWVAFTIAVRPAPHNLTVSSTIGGSIAAPGEGVFTYDEGTVVDLIATPGEGYRFVEWTGDVDTIADVHGKTTTVTMNGDYSITAEFVNQYDLAISGTEGGSIAEPGEGVFTYDEGTVVDLIATPDEGHRFAEWTGDVGTIVDVHAATTTITMNGDYFITADFIEQYNLTVSSAEGGSVAVPGKGVFVYDEGTVVDLMAIPDEGYQFDAWAGDVGTIADVYAAATTITMSSDCAITASFVRQCDLTISSGEGGSVTEPGEGMFTYDVGTVVNLIATPGEGYRFSEWIGDVSTIADVYIPATTIAVNGDYLITANFEEVPPPPAYPMVTTQAATDITTSSATLHMSYCVANYSLMQVRFAYKELVETEWSYTEWVSKSVDGMHAEVLTGLNTGTEHEFMAQLQYGDIIEGAILRFSTGTPPPSGSGGCFIATAAYGTPSAEQIDVLREFRDTVLLKNATGSQFVALYYRFSPPIANAIAGNEILRTLVRELLIDPIVWLVETTGDVWQN